MGDKLLVVGDPPAIAPMALLMSRAGQSLLSSVHLQVSQPHSPVCLCRFLMNWC